MISYKNGILTFYHDLEHVAKSLVEFLFAAYIIAVFVFYSVGGISPIVAAALFCASVLLQYAKGHEKFIIPKVSIWYLSVIILCALSLLWSEYVNTVMLTALIRLGFVLLLITSVSIYVDTQQDLEKIMKIFIICTLIIMAIEFSSVPIRQWSYGEMGSHFSGSNQNDISIWITAAELMAFYLAYSKGMKKYYICAALLLTFSIYSSSRKAIAVAIIGPLLFVFLSTYKKNYAFRIFIAAMIVAAVILFVMVDESAYYMIGRRIQSMFDYYSGDKSFDVDSSIYIRNMLIDVAKDMFSQSPFLGKGFVNYHILVSEYGMSNLYAHNNYWQVLSELGIVGFIVYYGFYFYCIVTLCSRIIIYKSRTALFALTQIIMILIQEYGIVSINSKYSLLVLGIASTATYISDEKKDTRLSLENEYEKIKWRN